MRFALDGEEQVWADAGRLFRNGMIYKADRAYTVR